MPHIQESLHTVWTPARITMHAKEDGEKLFELTYEPSDIHSRNEYPWRLVGYGPFDALGGAVKLWFANNKGAEYRALSEFIEAQAIGMYTIPPNKK